MELSNSASRQISSPWQQFTMAETPPSPATPLHAAIQTSRDENKNSDDIQPINTKQLNLRHSRALLTHLTPLNTTNVKCCRPIRPNFRRSCKPWALDTIHLSRFRHIRCRPLTQSRLLKVGDYFSNTNDGLLANVMTQARSSFTYLCRHRPHMICQRCCQRTHH